MFVALPVGAAAAFVLAVACGPGHLDAALVALSVLVFTVGYLSTLLAGVGIAGIAWLLLIGFVVDGEGVLRIHTADWPRLGLFAGITTFGWLIRVIATAFQNYNRPDNLPVEPYPGPANTAPISFRR